MFDEKKIYFANDPAILQLGPYSAHWRTGDARAVGRRS